MRKPRSKIYVICYLKILSFSRKKFILFQKYSKALMCLYCDFTVKKKTFYLKSKQLDQNTESTFFLFLSKKKRID